MKVSAVNVSYDASPALRASNTLELYAASPNDRDPPPCGDLVIRGPCPNTGSLLDLRGLYAEQARELSRFLLDTLPGGTIDALLVELLDAKRSSLRVYPYERS